MSDDFSPAEADYDTGDLRALGMSLSQALRREAAVHADGFVGAPHTACGWLRAAADRIDELEALLRDMQEHRK
jgi:hypothetical protein